MIADASEVGLLWQRLTRRRPRIEPEPGVVIGEAEGGRKVSWPPASKERASHVAIFAGSGSGKTVLVANVLAEQIAEEEKLPAPARTARCIIDNKGDLELHLLEALAERCPAALGRVHYLDAFDQGFAFNLRLLALGKAAVEVRALQLALIVSQVSSQMGEVMHGTGQRQLDLFQHLHLAVLTATHPDANLGWAADALSIKKGMLRLASVTGSREARQFLLDASLTEELRASCASRLRSVYALTPATQAMYCAPTCVQFDDLLGSGAITILANGRPPAGLAFLQAFNANTFARFALDHALERVSPWPGHHLQFVIDEAQVTAAALADRAEAVYTLGRSKGLSLTTITQGTVLLKQASESLLQVMLSNCPTKLIGRLNVQDAQLLARERSTRHGIDERLFDVQQRFIAQVANLPDRGFYRLLPGEALRFTSRPVDLDAWKRAADRLAAEIAAAKARLALPVVTRSFLVARPLRLVPGLGGAHRAYGPVVCTVPTAKAPSVPGRSEARGRR